MSIPILIRDATQDDLKQIHGWLAAEAEQGIDGCFFCNWSVIESSAQKQRLMVGFDPQTDTTVALLAWSVRCINILEVHHQWRGKGIGHQMVNALLERAKKDDWEGVEVDCCPQSSRPFWKKMGFQELPKTLSDDRILSVLLLPCKNTDIIPNCQVELKLISPKSQDAFDARFVGQSQMRISGERDQEGLLLAEDFVAYVEGTRRRLQISIDGQIIFSKATDWQSVEGIGGVRNTPWLRIRDLYFDEASSTTSLER